MRIEKNKRVLPRHTHAEMIAAWQQDPAFKAEYDALADEYQLLKEMLYARQHAGLTQDQVAQRMGTKAPAVARLESANLQSKHSPSINTLRKYATAVGCRLEIHLKPF